MVKLTIYTSAFNASKYIGQTIESIINQTFKDWEYFIVNDGSTDETVEIARKYSSQDDRIKIINHTHTGNPALLRNIGIKSGKGEWFANCDQDDIWHPLKVQLQMECANKLEKGGVIFTDRKNFISPKNIVNISELYNFLQINKIENTQLVLNEKINNNTLLNSCFILHSSTIVSKSVYDEIGLLNEDIILRGHDDYEFWLRAICKNIEFYQIKEILTFWRKHEENLSHEQPYEKIQAKINMINRARKCKNLRVEKKFDFYYMMSYLTYQVNKKKFQKKKSIRTVFWYICAKTKYYSIFVPLKKASQIFHNGRGHINSKQ